MGLETAALVTAGVGSAVNTAQGIGQGRAQQRRANRIEGLAGEQIQDGPGFLESILRSRFNTGQDGMMQMLNPNAWAEAGGVFDQSALFESLQPLRARQLSQSLSAGRSAPGLGQRFGSSNMNREQQTILQHLQQITAQDAALQSQSFESAANRGLGVAQLLQAVEQARRGGNLQAISLMSGIPQAQQTPLGQPFMDIGQLLLLRQLTGQQPAGPTGPQSAQAPPPSFMLQPQQTFTPQSFWRN